MSGSEGAEGGCTPSAWAGSDAPVSTCLNSTSSCRDLALGVGSSASLGFVMVFLELPNSSLEQASQRAGPIKPTIIHPAARNAAPGAEVTQVAVGKSSLAAASHQAHGFTSVQGWNAPTSP